MQTLVCEKVYFPLCNFSLEVLKKNDTFKIVVASPSYVFNNTINYSMFEISIGYCIM